MTIYQWLILTFWIVFVAFWAASAIGAKRNIGGRAWRRESGLRLGVILLVLLALRIPVLRRAVRNMELSAANIGALAGAVGVLLCGLGIGLASWAPIHLGRN
jgi:hypothetical protein